METISLCIASFAIGSVVTSLFWYVRYQKKIRGKLPNY